MYVLRELKGGKQFYMTLGSLNLGAICMGITIGWTEPGLFYFTLPNVTYEGIMTDDAMLQSIMNFGSSVGVIVPMCLVDILGRKRVFGISGAVDAASWIILTIASNNTIFVIAAFVGGIAIGTFFTTMTLYITEISLSTNRGTVGALTIFCIYIGIFTTQCVAVFSNIQILIYIMCIVPLMFLICTTFWMVESPYFLYQRGKVMEAKQSLKSLRGMRTVLEIDEEFKSMIQFFDTDQNFSSKAILYRVFKPKSVKKSVAIVLPILSVSQMLGDYAIEDYTEQVIEIVLPNYGKLLLSYLNVVSVGVCLYMVEKIGRKPLLYISVFGSSLCCFTLGVYRFVEKDQCQVSNRGNVVVSAVTISIYYAVYFLGLIPLLPILTGEIFPCRVKTIAVGLCMMFIYLTVVAMERIYELLNDKTGECLAFFAYMLFGSMGAPLMMVYLPETKGKSLHQIQEELEDVFVVI